jgi:hypothetical protein
VRLTIAGEQTEQSFAYVGVTALDASDNPLTWFSVNHDNRRDSAIGYLVPTTVPTDSNFQFELVVPITNQLLTWSKAKLALFDRSAAVSNELIATVVTQPERHKNDACDPVSRVDRCAAGLECSAATSTCVTHTGPHLDKAGYWSTNDGPILIATGTDNADDLTSVDISFLDASGSSVQVNMNNDTENPVMASSFLEPATACSNDGQIAFHINPTPTFTDVVKGVSMVPVDAAGLKGAAVTATLQAQPERGSGAACDIHGLDYCSGTAVCYPGSTDAKNTCQPTTAMQTTECKSAPVLDLGTTSHLVTGYCQGSSLWEPPFECAAQVGQRHPESVIKLRVPTQVASLTLSTDRPETQIDTILYVISSCGSLQPTTLGCNDDSKAGNVTSLVHLSNVAAGEYYVIVDSLSDEGGPFGLIASTQ